MFLGNCVLKMCSKFTVEHLCHSVISIKLLCNFIEIMLRHEFFLVNFAANFQNTCSYTSEGLLLSNIRFGWNLVSENVEIGFVENRNFFGNVNVREELFPIEIVNSSSDKDRILCSVVTDFFRIFLKITDH